MLHRIRDINPTPTNDLFGDADGEALTSCADLIVHYLSMLNVPYVFGVPGGNIDPLCCALAKHQQRSGVRWVLTRSESGAGFMAAGVLSLLTRGRKS